VARRPSRFTIVILALLLADAPRARAARQMCLPLVAQRSSQVRRLIIIAERTASLDASYE
jgi:hypothetical protein